MILDRVSPPAFADIEPFTLIKPEAQKSASGLTAFILEHGHQEVCRIEYAFPAGKWYEPYTGISYFTAKLVTEGTRQKDTGLIQQIIAQHGAFFEVSTGNDQVVLTIYVLSRYFKPMAALLEEMIGQPALSSAEFEKLRIQTRQNYFLNIDKTSYLASRAFLALLFGDQHPYGCALDEQAIEKISLDDVVKYHQHAFHWNQANIFVSGRGKELLPGIQEALQRNNTPGPILGKPAYHPPRVSGKMMKVDKPGAVQSTVKAGFFIPERTHHDFPAMYLYNEIFGGYFGSRLMQNIREDKGFTYGIYSSMVHDPHASYWTIQADVNGENAEATVREVKIEMNKMREELVTEAELKVVKNYILGSFISSLDTPFTFMDKFKTTHFNRLGENYYENLMQQLLAVTPAQIQAVAVCHFDPDQLNVVIAG
jgi:zinc protease